MAWLSLEICYCNDYNCSVGGNMNLGLQNRLQSSEMILWVHDWFGRGIHVEFASKENVIMGKSKGEVKKTFAHRFEFWITKKCKLTSNCFRLWKLFISLGKSLANNSRKLGRTLDEWGRELSNSGKSFQLFCWHTICSAELSANNVLKLDKVQGK